MWDLVLVLRDGDDNLLPASYSKGIMHTKHLVKHKAVSNLSWITMKLRYEGGNFHRDVTSPQFPLTFDDLVSRLSLLLASWICSVIRLGVESTMRLKCLTQEHSPTLENNVLVVLLSNMKTNLSQLARRVCIFNSCIFFL